MRDEICPYEFIISLAVALEKDEQERFWEYVLAGGKPKKFKWVYRDIIDKSGINLAAMVENVGGGLRGDIANLAHMSGIQRVSKRVYTLPDGRVLEEYIDQDGNVIDATDKVFMRSRQAEAKKRGGT